MNKNWRCLRSKSRGLKLQGLTRALSKIHKEVLDNFYFLWKIIFKEAISSPSSSNVSLVPAPTFNLELLFHLFYSLRIHFYLSVHTAKNIQQICFRPHPPSCGTNFFHILNCLVYILYFCWIVCFHIWSVILEIATALRNFISSESIQVSCCLIRFWRSNSYDNAGKDITQVHALKWR